jgi:uncharacterized membrane protein YfcA
MVFVVYLLLGCAAGLLAGLFGVGGGVIIVPVLLLAFAALDVPASVATHLAVGTSLATIVVTSISSIRAHHKKGAVLWPVFWLLAPGLALGVLIGAQVAARLPGAALQLTIGGFLVLIGIQMGFGLQPPVRSQLPGRSALFGVGNAIGFASALFGIGGGSLTVPFLSYCDVRMQKAVATSAACGLPIALFGAIGNIAGGWHHNDLPVYATGFVYWPALLGIALASTPAARLGAQLAHRLPAEKLKRLFALFTASVGAYLIIEIVLQRTTV